MSLRREIVTAQCVICATPYVQESTRQRTCKHPVCQQRRLVNMQQRNSETRAARRAAARETDPAAERLCAVCSASYYSHMPSCLTCSQVCKATRRAQGKRQAEAARRAQLTGKGLTQKGTPLKPARPARATGQTFLQRLQGGTACSGCAHGIASEASSIGWECGIWVSRRCGPLTGTPVFFEPARC